MNTLLKANALLPTYNRDDLRTRIAHIGFGAFHRAHQALYADILAQDFNGNWGYCEINLLGGEQQIQDLKEQDCLFSVTEFSENKTQARVIAVVKKALHLTVDGIEAILDALTQEDIAIVSLTITEKGYYYAPATGQLMLDSPMIVQDLANPRAPISAIGVIVEALRRRKESNIQAFSVLSCDNMPANGVVTRNVILGYADKLDSELSQWIAKNVTFPSTMVDRIVPAITNETMERIESNLKVQDKVAIGSEPFKQWVIEDNFVKGRPEWEKAGAMLVKDVLPFEEMKLRMLNGSHSFLAYTGRLIGCKFINECMKDTDLMEATKYLMLQEQAVTLKVQGVNLQQYASELIARFENPELKHRTEQIATDGSQKLPQRILDSIRVHLKNGTNFDYLALAVASWMQYIKGFDDAGQSVEVNDPMKPIFNKVCENLPNDSDRVLALLSIKDIFSDDLIQNSLFVKKVTDFYVSLNSNGAKKTLIALNSKTK